MDQLAVMGDEGPRSCLVHGALNLPCALVMKIADALLLSCSPPVIPMGNSCFHRQARPSRLNAQLSYFSCPAMSSFNCSSIP